MTATLNPDFGKSTIITPLSDSKAEIKTKSFADRKLLFEKTEIEETLKIDDVNELINPVIDLVTKVKNGHSTSVSMTAQCITQANGRSFIKVTKKWLISGEKK